VELADPGWGSLDPAPTVEKDRGSSSPLVSDQYVLRSTFVPYLTLYLEVP
jgi:hypothetical protein